MEIQGAFGYKIGKKVRLMHVQSNADILWQTCIREIYILLKHYPSIDELRTAFESLKPAKNKPKKDAIEKCKFFTDIKYISSLNNSWDILLKYCQHSFINVLQSGYFLANGIKEGYVFILDFNTNSARFFKSDKELATSTFEEILLYEEMPTLSLDELVRNMENRYQIFSTNLSKINNEINRLQIVIEKTKELGGEQNIIQKARRLLENAETDRQRHELDYKFFYHRLDALNLIEKSNV